ncbi:hypothetical protein [Clostridium merdae]|uniref:hypothetical protein n=1 Tax=Clostridium merdae TaxID=1958780 RepID=UPI000A26A4FE|nr:hypothetical protein [Clostridium merdae]
MKQVSNKNLKISRFLGWLFGIIISPFSIIAAITVPFIGIVLLALNVLLIWYAIQSSKELKRRKLTENIHSNLKVQPLQQQNLKQEISRQPDSSVPEKEPIIRIPDTIGEYKLEYNYRDLPFNVLGDLSSAVGGEELTFSIEPEETYIYIGDILIGSMQENRQKDMIRDFINRSEPIKAVLSAYDGELSAKMFIAFYRTPKYKRLMEKGAKFTSYKLTGTNKSEFQDNIALCSVGESVEYSYDFEKEKYLAACGLDIGYFPKKLNELLESEPEVFVQSIEEDVDGKYTVVVSVFD